jgi:hypothetical protein
MQITAFFFAVGLREFFATDSMIGFAASRACAIRTDASKNLVMLISGSYVLLLLHQTIKENSAPDKVDDYSSLIEMTFSRT